MRDNTNSLIILQIRFTLIVWSLLAVYGVVLDFPFYSDDIPVMTFVESVTLRDLWTQPDAFGTYYRPLSYSVHALYRWFDAWAFYALGLFAHLVNVALLIRLARLLRLPIRAQVAAALLFAFFPASAQPLTWIAAGVHLFSLTLLLTASCAILHFLRHPGWPASVIALLAGAALPFTTENGMLLLPLAGLLVFYRWGWEVRWRYLFLLGVPLVWITWLYWSLRSAILADVSLAGVPIRLGDNWPFVLQWLTFPTQWIGALLPRFTVVGQVAAGASLFILIVALLHVFARRHPGLWLTGTAFALLAALPAAALLHPAYLIWGERLLYWSSVGFALMVAATLLTIPARAGSLVLGSVLALALSIIWPHRLDLQIHNAMAQTILSAFEVEQRDTFFINLPAQSDRPHPGLPLTTLAAFMFSDWINFDDFVTINQREAITADVRVVQAPWMAPDWNGRAVHSYGDLVASEQLPAQMRQYERIYTTQATADGPQLRQIAERLDPLVPVASRFADAVAQSVAAVGRVGDHVVVALDWQRLGRPIPAQTVAFVHLVCNGEIIAQADAAPLLNTHPFAHWEQGEAWRDWRYLDAGEVNCAAPQIRYGLYDFATGDRLPLEDGAEWRTIPIAD